MKNLLVQLEKCVHSVATLIKIIINKKSNGRLILPQSS